MKASEEWILAEMERIYRFAYHRVPEQDAGDLTQEILVAALSHAHTVREEEKRIPWLWGVARNVYKRYLSGRRETPTEITVIEGMSALTRKTAIMTVQTGRPIPCWQKTSALPLIPPPKM